MIEYQNIEETVDYAIKNVDFKKCVNKILSIIAFNENIRDD